MAPDVLGDYLDRINQTMEAHGFGRNPNLNSANAGRITSRQLNTLNVEGESIRPHPVRSGRVGKTVLEYSREEIEAWEAKVRDALRNDPEALSRFSASLTRGTTAGTEELLRFRLSQLQSLIEERNPHNQAPASNTPGSTGQDSVVHDVISKEEAVLRGDEVMGKVASLMSDPETLDPETLDGVLRSLLDEGLALRNATAELIGSSRNWDIVTATGRMPTGEEDIREWERHVIVALSSRPLEIAKFNQDPPIGLFRAFSIRNPLRARLDHRLKVLEKIILGVQHDKGTE